MHEAPDMEARRAQLLNAIVAWGTGRDDVRALARLDRMIRENVLDPLFDRGYRVLIDKDAMGVRLPLPSLGFAVRPLPSQEQFRMRVEEFWFEAFHVPRYLAWLRIPGGATPRRRRTTHEEP
jgi:hypothetical protein